MAFKVVILGDSGVGKTSLIEMRMQNSFDSEKMPTIKPDVSTCVENVDGKQIELNIWDTAGQEQYFSLATMFVRDANVAILVGDITNEISIDNIGKWEHLLKETQPNAEVIVAINKSDLARNNQKLVGQVRDKLIHNYTDIMFVSAITGNNVPQLFKTVAQKCHNINFESENALKITPKQTEKKECC
ncbi:small GTP-binding protein, putative [Trichomonas vaginalis G3]|uniref:Small GTP-binding protein, putative n=1 Tax=Trichomonas vaginalis (strain ATCC PRA-98 / G3) TaxID=412133 RepID=A2EMB9_TRIV3|nr:retrograde vesicle-mediated transport, Golgi to ER [Trichomonas vaginalis G3]EAY06231.1 small GTP-binding protein, putative [Trichomonas vaginalis G3]KAI5509639.1 retrograde vesicle-mediated transport, Golgi to ER [Trichomonas vaginalis G3]|eukprot:XP_001318454.1 small GTP-binding protein [Trichomonas vaginalis G3]